MYIEYALFLVWMKILTFKHQPHRMVKYTETIRRQQPTNCLSVFDHVFFGEGGGGGAGNNA